MSIMNGRATGLERADNNPDLNESRANLALCLSFALRRYAVSNLIAEHQYLGATTGMNIDEGLSSNNQYTTEVNRFMAAVSDPRMHGERVELRSDANITKEPIVGTLGSFALQKFVPVIFEINADRDQDMIDRWEGRLLVSVDGEDKPRAVPFMAVSCWIKPETPRGPRQAVEPAELRVYASGTGYDQAILGEDRVEFGVKPGLSISPQ